jgi:apolipoprotein N-acyltransferase
LSRRASSAASGHPPHLGFAIQRYGVIALLVGVSLLLWSLIYPPLDQWYLAYFCMVPWLIVVGGTAIATRVYVSAWLLGFAFFLINMWWMEGPTGMGYVALSAYLACYFPLAAWPIRYAVRRRRLPLALAVPIVWVSAEFLRGLIISGFPWFFLAHSQYKLLSMIQISDLVGAYGVTFVVVAVNGAITDVVLSRWGRSAARVTPAVLDQRRQAKFSVMFAAVLVVLTLGYGVYQLNRDTITEGPKIALLQQNYPNSSDMELARTEPSAFEKRDAYFEQMARARKYNPDLYLFPESAWMWMYLNTEFQNADESMLDDSSRRVLSFSRECYAMLQEWCRSTGAHIVIGSTSNTPTPLSLRQERILQNSAFHFTPDGKPPKRHNKVHPVLFGERVPFRFGRMRYLYVWLNGLSPFGMGGFEYSLTPGDEVQIFEMKTREPDSKTYRFGVPICYEDVMPYVCRAMTWDPKTRSKRVDFLLNISNDGWFLQRNEQQQHFAICTFRAIENRVGIARTVNTGVSGFVDPNGRAYDKIGVGQTAYTVARVMTDSRCSLYSRIGDVFAILCTAIAGLFYVDYIVTRTMARRRARRRQSP